MAVKSDYGRKEIGLRIENAIAIKMIMRLGGNLKTKYSIMPIGRQYGCDVKGNN